MSQVSMKEETTREQNRHKDSGRFGSKTQSEPAFTLAGQGGEAGFVERLHDYADGQADTIEGRSLANKARLAVAAHLISESVPAAASFTMEKDAVDNAWDSRGYPVDAGSRAQMAEILREAGVAPISTLTDLSTAREWTPDAITPTSPRVTSKGRTVFVTLPDGVVVDRTSKTRAYSYAIVASPEDPEAVKAEARLAIEVSQAVIDDIDGALAGEKLRIRGRRRFNDNRDPDLSHRGEPVYSGFEYKIYSADGKRELGYVWGNSKQEVQGCYDEEGGYDGKTITKVFPAAAGRLAEKRRLHQEAVDRAASTIKSVEDGTYSIGGWAVYSFSASAANAEKAARASQGYTPTRRFAVMPIDV